MERIFFLMPLVFGLAFSAGGLYGIYLGQRLRNRQRLLYTAAEVAPGTVVSKRKEVSGDDTTWYLAVSFQAGTHGRITEEQAVSTAFWNKMRQGMPVTIRYFRQRPTDFMIVEDRLAKSEPYLMVGCGVVLLVVGVAVTMLGLAGLMAGMSAISFLGP